MHAFVRTVLLRGSRADALVLNAQPHPPDVELRTIGILSFYSPGIRSGGLFVMTPIYLQFGLPIEGVGILIALDFIPDMFLTTANVTADLAVTALMAASTSATAPPADAIR